MSEIDKIKIENAITECQSHILRITRATTKLTAYFPLSETTLNQLSDDQIETLDQFIYRFTKLQDTMASRLFGPLTNLILGNGDPRPFIDTLHTLEKFHLIPSAHQWQKSRNLRNQLAHEYPHHLKQMVDTLNILFNEWTQLKIIFETSKDYYQNKLK